MPLIINSNSGYFTGFNVQNVGGSTVTVNCTFQNNARVVTKSLAPGEALNDLQLDQTRRWLHRLSDLRWWRRRPVGGCGQSVEERYG